MQAQQFKAAIATFSEVIRRKPAFAEGWNKRATVLFLAGELRKSLADCDEVMKRNPNHFGALAGYGQIYFQLEQYEKAIEYWKRALGSTRTWKASRWASRAPRSCSRNGARDSASRSSTIALPSPTPRSRPSPTARLPMPRVT